MICMSIGEHATRVWRHKIAVQVLTSGFQRTTKTTDAEDLDTGELLLNARMLLFTELHLIVAALLPAVAFMICQSSEPLGRVDIYIMIIIEANLDNSMKCRVWSNMIKHH